MPETEFIETKPYVLRWQSALGANSWCTHVETVWLSEEGVARVTARFKAVDPDLFRARAFTIEPVHRAADDDMVIGWVEVWEKEARKQRLVRS